MKINVSKVVLCLALTLGACWASSTVKADEDDGHEHKDIIVGYNSGADRIVFETPAPGLLKPRLFEAEFTELLGAWTTDDPGFSGEAGEYEFTYGHDLFLRVINASTYFQNGSNLGYVSFFDGANFSAVGQINVLGNNSDTLNLNGSSLSSSPTAGLDYVFLQQSNATFAEYGGIHDHVNFDMVDGDNQANGAYGILFQLFSRNGGNLVAESDAFWVVFNKGVDDTLFDGYVAQFGNFSAVPEPSSGLLLCGVALAAFAGRRRR